MVRRGRKGRDISGILLLDKPAGITSNAALQQVKRLFNACKAGHTGSLDPLATGVLPLCFGEATRFSRFLLDADKYYRARVRLGVSTDSGDADGEIVATRPVPDITDARLESVLERYRGEISQVPSMFSALKVNGQPLYKLARQGVEVAREARRVTIHELTVRGRSGDELTLDVRSSKGTYVRTLVEDIGRDLGCGAHVAGLRRLAAGPFRIEETITLPQLEKLSEEDRSSLDATLQPVAAAVKDWPAVGLTEVTASYLRQGQPVQVANAPTNGWVSLFAKTGVPDTGVAETPETSVAFIGVGEVLDDGRVAPRRLVAG